MKPRLVVSGTLNPGDGVPGCTFEVFLIRELVEESIYHVVLRSPHGGKYLVDEGEVKEDEIFSWLMDRCDY